MKEQLIIFKSLFKGREDVFAFRWEHDDKSGYMPAYDFNWDEFRTHKNSGGTLKDFSNKQYSSLTDQKILNHLLGKDVIGVYPLLENNTSWYIVADFDQSTAKNISWIDECRLFIIECEKHKLPVYLERSRSGNGGHVWMFFDQPYPAFKSRKIFLQLLNNSGVISNLNKSSNFDRLFPNQDEHSGKGLGNLIALPLQKIALEKQNSCFINPNDLKPFPDQWNYLQNIKRISISQLNELYNSTINPTRADSGDAESILSSERLYIKLDNQITLPRSAVNSLLLTFLKDNLSFLNREYFIKKQTGNRTYGTPVRINILKDRDDKIIIPRGFIGKLLRHCRKQNINFNFIDKRTKLEKVKFVPLLSLYDYQETAVELADKKDMGVIVAPPGSGKTIMALSIIARKEQPALIIVHRKQLFDQWIERIQTFLGIPKFKIGKIENGKYEIGKEISIAMIQSLQSEDLPHKIYHSFGTIIVDECHHIPAATFQAVIKNFHSYYLYGFTATPFRKNKDEKLIFIYIGDIIHEVTIPASYNLNSKLSLHICVTDFFAPFNISTDKLETLLHILIHDTARNELIVNNILTEVKTGRKTLVLTERKAHIEILLQYLKGVCETITLTGEDNEQIRKLKLKQIENGDFQVLIATGQFIGEGTDIGILNCLVLAYPFSFEGKLIQYIGRVQRSIDIPIIYDYRDYKVEYLDQLFKQRNKYYRKLLRAGKLTKLNELLLIFTGFKFSINDATENFLLIDCLDLPMHVECFRSGIIWKIRVLNYNEEKGELFAEIIDYAFPSSEISDTSQTSFYFCGIEKIKFRNIDTSGFLRSVILKKQPVSVSVNNILLNDIAQQSPIENVVLKTMKVPFWKISFLNGAVSFPVYVEAVKQEIIFEIVNFEIWPEFEAIRNYFEKALKKKTINIEIAVRYTLDKILSASAKSEDIDSIDSSMIDNMRFEFVKSQILKTKQREGDKIINTIDELLSQNKEEQKLFLSERDWVADILNVKKSRHFLQLKYLSARHEVSILKVRFVLQPFSFLFLLSGEKKYHIVWETLDSDEATYIWHVDKTHEALRVAIAEIEIILSEIKITGKQDYLKKEHLNFSRIHHDYLDVRRGFTTWKGSLEERLI